MSSHICPIVKLGPALPIPGADKIEMFEIVGNGPVIVQKGQFKENDLACFIPPESCVNTADSAFDFLSSKARKSDGWCKIRPVRLRGQLSVGLLLDPVGLSEGADGSGRYKVKKFEDHIKIEQPQPKALPWYSRLWKRYFGTR